MPITAATLPPHLALHAASLRVDPATGELAGSLVDESTRTLGELAGLFGDEAARQAMDADTLAYRVLRHHPVEDGNDGGLFFGTSFVQPGRVGDEYFMTRGHFHSRIQAGEYYWCIAGQGVLILMDEQRRCWGERLEPGTVHYIPGRIAHRLANTGATTLHVGACWPADAGHDYAAIAERGFSARLRCIDGQPRLVEAD
ncbi:MAG: glucose-6-phosphate isomerase family protein [Phycisphaeraceae bacterium]